MPGDKGGAGDSNDSSLFLMQVIRASEWNLYFTPLVACDFLFARHMNYTFYVKWKK